MRLSKTCYSEREIEAALATLRAEATGMGPTVQKFEVALKSYTGTKGEVVAVNTGTSALHLAAQAVGLKAGDECLIPSLTFVGSFQAVRATGATPVACDVRRGNGLVDLKDCEKRLTSKTKAIMYVDYASEVDGSEEILAWAKAKGLRAISDAAHSFGCNLGGKKTGSYGDVTCFSFDGIKNITCGEGGAVLSEDSSVIERAKNARLLGVEKDSERRYLKQRSWDFDVSEPGWRYHMAELNAAIGLVQLDRFETDFANQRIRLSQGYRDRLRDVRGVEVLSSSHGKNGNRIVQHIFPILVPADKRDALRDFLFTKSVETGIHYKPSHLLTLFKKPGVALPIVEELYSRELTLPMHPDLTEADQDTVVAALREFFSNNA